MRAHTMHRLAALLATSALALTGCYSRSDEPPPLGNLILYWNFQSAAGQTAGNFNPEDTGCAVAGVDTVRIAIDDPVTGRFVVDQPCEGQNGVPGATLTNFERGAYGFTMQGYRGAELAYTASGTVDAEWGVDRAYSVTLQAVMPQSLVLYYDVNGAMPTQCAVGGQPVAAVELDLFDALGNPVFAQPQQFSCDPASFGIVTPALPAGSYTVRYLALLSAQDASLAQICGAPVSHTGFSTILDLRFATTTCP